jgi:hypothetical protein
MTREEIIATDPERDATLAALETWHHAVSDGKVTLQTLIQRASEDGDLKSALLEVAADSKHPDEINSRVLAWWCRNRVGRVIGAHKLLRAGAAHGGFKTWQVIRVADEKVIREV